MNNQISGLVNRLQQFRLTRFALPVLASFLLLFGTACNPSSPSVSGTGSYQEGRQPQTELYRTIQPKEGGMNRYSDTDPRRDTSRAATKADQMIRQAERNLNKVQSREDLADEVREAKPFKQGVNDISGRVEGTIEDLREDISEGTQKGIKNIQRNTSQAQQGVQESFDDTRQNLGDASRKTVRGAERTADQVKGKVDDVRQDVTNKVSKTLDSGERNVGQSGKDLQSLRSTGQRTPDLDAKDLADRAKDTFGQASKNFGEFGQDTAARK